VDVISNEFRLPTGRIPEIVPTRKHIPIGQVADVNPDMIGQTWLPDHWPPNPAIGRPVYHDLVHIVSYCHDPIRKLEDMVLSELRRSNQEEKS
jgi:hypothetical protein